MRYPGRSRRFDREGDSGAWYGGRPRIGTYLLINLYGPFGAGRINRNARTWKKRRRATEAEQGEIPRVPATPLVKRSRRIRSSRFGEERRVSSAFFIARFKSTKGALILFITIIKRGHRGYSGVRAPREAIKYL